MNYFEPKNTAKRYAVGRPKFHSVTIDRIKTHLNLKEKLDKALDIACGTGLSTDALLSIAKNVFGTDASAEMLNNAISKDNIHYSLSFAENQPFSENEFELITVCSGIHWFNIDDFLKEANRLLKINSHLVIYDNFFNSEMVENQSFNEWFPNNYLNKFPTPKRNNSFDWSNSNLNKFGFKLIKDDHFKNEITFNKKELILYFTTQSNISDAIQRGESYVDIESWLNAELSPFFENNDVKKTFKFGNWIKYIQRIK
ncbi:MAG: class I SAM-dependent methyltransferase [Chitinophagales bacterium]